MKKNILAICVAFMMILGGMAWLAVPAAASGIDARAGIVTIASGTCGERLVWTLASDGTLTIEGTGVMNNYEVYSDVPWSELADRVERVVLRDGVESIGDLAFSGCSGMTSISIPDSVTSIGAQAFEYCLALTDIVIPKNVASIGTQAFSYCVSLTSISVDEANTTYSAVDGVLFNKDQSVLISYPIGRAGAYAIPNGVTAIADFAFSGSSSLSSVSMPEGVKSVGICAFMNCNGLGEVTFSESITDIGYGAFFGCNSLPYVIVPANVANIGELAFGYVYTESETTLVDGYTIYGYVGTAAEAYAAANNIEFFNIEEAFTGIRYDEATGKYFYYVLGKVDTTKNGLVPYEDGLWYYFENGEWITNKYDLVEYNGGKFFVVNGLYESGISGLQLIGDNFYFLSYGQLQDYTGLALYDGEFFYVENGILAINYYGLLDYDGSKFLIAAGRIVGDYVGLYNDAVSGNWFYIVYGQVQTEYTGLVAYDGAWFYLVNGVLASDYVGTVIYDGAEFQVVYGMVVS